MLTVSELEVDVELHDGWSDIDYDSDGSPSPNNDPTVNFT